MVLTPDARGTQTVPSGTIVEAYSYPEFNMRAFSRRLVLPFVLLALVTACASRSRSNRPPASVEPTYVRVTNQSWLDMNVYVLRSSQRLRLGTVSANQTQRFTLPQNLIFGATPLRFLADPIGSSRTAQSFEIVVSPGDEVTLTIPPGVR
jgi:hypothetical protein